MNLETVEEIKELFTSKAPQPYYYTSGLFIFSGNNRNWSVMLFSGEDDSAEKVASLSITASNGKFMVELWIGLNRYTFFDNFELCKELIERFVPSYHKSLNHG